jgi:signal transduction histidine kinase
MLRSSSFRLALIYMALFGVSVLILLGFIYWSTAGTMTRQVDETIEAEIKGLAEHYRSDGLTGLSAIIARRVSQPGTGSAIYLLTDAHHKPVVGNLDRWPLVEADADGWLVFELGSRQEGIHQARARSFQLQGGFLLLVGRDVHDLEQAKRRIISALIWGLLITVVLALIGGSMMTRSTVRRLEAITRTSREIMAGDLSQRIPGDGSGDDFDLLAVSLNAMLERIETLMEEVKRVSDNIAHDLKTPLTRLKGDLEQLEASLDGDEPKLQQALDEADGLLATFGALMRIARVESGARRAAFAEVELARVVSDAVGLYQALADERGQRLRLSIARRPVIAGDRDLLFQMLANLLDNAIKFTPPGGELAVTLDSEDGQARLVVRDSGPGIPAAQREPVLQRFFRLEQSRSTPGNGLGLSMVAAIVKLHEGRLQLRDGEPGLMVVIALPLAAAGVDKKQQRHGSG